MTNDWITAKEAAVYLKLHPSTVLKWAKRGAIPAHKLSRSARVIWRFSKSELDEYLKSRPNVILDPASAAETGRVH